ncbi:hypothetical protein K474DRAFT_1706752 [Panus rudis PR-1116 ss-1]|nr:hypothetical protein K474DRAFT_1706752 [Panus rudis PR-1116 ss-1]
MSRLFTSVAVAFIWAYIMLAASAGPTVAKREVEGGADIDTRGCNPGQCADW